VGDGDCARFQKVCDEVVGACVGCTIDSEAAQCAGKSCNPATKACTQTALKSVDECHKCTADSECLDANHRCVAMNYQGTARGGYCLRRQSAVCTRPYGTETTRGSLSGAPIETYCGVDELVTSCEAVLALLMDKGCPSGQASQCEAPGAICGTVGGFPQRCSYGCEASRSCPDVLDLACPTSGNNKFCGK
jgi:hypothetical protein